MPAPLIAPIVCLIIDDTKAREPFPPCDFGATSINAASFDAYNFAPRPRVPSPSTNAHHLQFLRSGTAGPFIFLLTISVRPVSALYASTAASAATSPDFVLIAVACQHRPMSDRVLSISAAISPLTGHTGPLTLIAGQTIG
ncbi:hypothetical protein HPB52_024572 [Rhipicephalus sanguineus]|uniref:Uncharacterized protein n=1 Tax=Rhipicephalus sanguineus TaxID=34632 RepID=A0A9D4YS47_RHISA|nr:hypothetical protein HPB52_024572 [Rhipicephalus sanguineus]